MAPGADLLSIASAMLKGDDLRTHFKNKPPPGAVVHFGDMPRRRSPGPRRRATTRPAWAAAERDRLTRAHDDRAVVARAQSRARADVDRLVDAHQDRTLRTARLDAQAAAKKATADSQNQKNAATKAAADARQDQARARARGARRGRPGADPGGSSESGVGGLQKARRRAGAADAHAGRVARAAPRGRPARGDPAGARHGRRRRVLARLEGAHEGVLRRQAPGQGGGLKYKASARKRREAEAAQRRAEEEAALKAAADEAALAAQREVLIHAKMPELEEPCDLLDELCKANYENESDDAWLARIRLRRSDYAGITTTSPVDFES